MKFEVNLTRKQQEYLGKIMDHYFDTISIEEMEEEFMPLLSEMPVSDDKRDGIINDFIFERNNRKIFS